MKKPAHPLFRILRTTLATGVLGLGVLTACQSRFIYFPNPYQPDQTDAFLKSGGLAIDFQTSQGPQTAWLKLPANNATTPEHVWIVTAGNGSLGLDYSDLPDGPEFTDDAFVFIDYPGYGRCSGKPDPGSIRESFRVLGPIITERCHLPADGLATRGIIWGHSLGAATGLIAAEEYNITRAVLLSPFTSTMAMSERMFHLPLGFLVTHRFDNTARLASLIKRGGTAWIFHGSSDEVVPVSMGRELAKSGGPAVIYNEVPGARHNNLLTAIPGPILEAMKAARRPETPKPPEAAKPAEAPAASAPAPAEAPPAAPAAPNP